MLTVLSLFPFYFAGLGFLVLFPACSRLGMGCDSHQGRARLLAIVFLLGISVDYLLVLVFEKLSLSLQLGGGLAVAGLFAAAFMLFRGTLASVFRLGWMRWGIVIALLIFYGIPILAEPVGYWDARSVWLFHGKIIYFNKALNASAGWDDNTIGYHALAEYPKLFPVLQAQFAHAVGVWNELVPKSSLFAFLIPALLAACCFYKKINVVFIYFVLFFFFCLDDYLFSGLMDGYLALYAVFAILFYARWLQQGDNIDFLAGTLFMATTCSMKNEGLLFTVSAGLSLLVLLVAGRKIHRVSSVLKSPALVVLALLPFINVFLWKWKKSAWGLKDFMDIGVNTVPRIYQRLSEGSLPMVVKSLVIDSNVYKALIILLICLLVARLLRVRPSLSTWLAGMTAAIYLAGMLMVYLSTPWPLSWHLDTSADRTTVTVLHTVFCTTFLLLSDLFDSIDSSVNSHSGNSESIVRAGTESC